MNIKAYRIRKKKAFRRVLRELNELDREIMHLPPEISKSVSEAIRKVTSARDKWIMKDKARVNRFSFRLRNRTGNF